MTQRHGNEKKKKNMKHMIMERNDITVTDLIEERLRKIVREEVTRALVNRPARKPYTRAETAAKMRVTTSTLHNWSVSGKLVPIKMGRRVLYDADEVDSLLRET